METELDVIEARWALANWAVRVALPVWGLSTVCGGVEDLMDVPRLLSENASSDGLDALRQVQYLPEPVHGFISPLRGAEVEIALNETGFGNRARRVLASGGIPWLIWLRARAMCRLYALEQADTFTHPENWEGWNAWLSGCVKTSNLLGSIHPSFEGWDWQG